MHNQHVIVVRGGAPGLAAAWSLSRAGFAVTILEKSAQFGGACLPVSVPMPNGAALQVDLGVTDFNQATYSAFDRLLRQLGVVTVPVCQDAVAVDPDGQMLWWSGTGHPNTSLPGLSGELERFHREAHEALSSQYDGWSLSGWLAEHGYSETFLRGWAIPRSVGCFLMPAVPPEQFPCLLYTSPSPRDRTRSRMPSSA